ncbi:hypothetical protein ACJIZ3_001269 [Penstemon smallii]|uniref:Uncharacterized protein n=1 Tax=Penstemon smallii TaxID=265156 RepID=A0ABD3U4N0_9LAMI
MVANRSLTRVDTLELKNHIYQKVGHQRAETYFHQLKRFLDLKLSKSDFDRSCISTIGRENIFLHNQLIRSILQNGFHSSIPPPKVDKPSVKVINGYQESCLRSLNGDSFPRKCRSRKFQERPSPLGPLGKSPSFTCEETVSKLQEQQSATELHRVEDGEEVEQYFSVGPTVPRWSSITAPVGVSLNTGGGGARKAIIHGGATCQKSGELPDTESLSGRLEKKLASEGVGISMDCANLMNNSLDVFMKRLIEPCLGMAGSVSTDPRILGRQSNNNNQMMSVSGSRFKDPRILGKQSSNKMVSRLNGTLQQKLLQPTNVSMLDFRVAMESNPRVLGQDCYTQLEKICHYGLKE